RETSERKKHGVIPGSLHAPYPDLRENIGAGGVLHELAAATAKKMLFYCAFGERSAMAVQAAQGAGLSTACHIQGGLDAWEKADGPLARSIRIWLRNSWVRSCCGLLKKASGSFISTIWPSSMKTMRFATWRAKPISWVTTSMVMPSMASCTMVSSTSLTISGSSDEVGSSNSMIFGCM